MFFLARKNLVQEKARFFISIGGVAFSVLLMILLQALNIGFSNVLGQYFNTVPADLWVAHANTGNIMDMSLLPLTMRSQIQRIDGVASVKPFGMQSLTTGIHGKNLEFYLISYDAADNIGQPAQVSQGKSTPNRGEIVVDRIVAKSNNIKLGDSIQFGNRQLKTVGFSEGTFLLSSSFAFINGQDADSIYGMSDSTNYWLVLLKPGANADSIKTIINSRIPGVTAHTKAHFVQENVDVIKSIVQPVFGSLVVLGAAIGMAVIGLTIFTSTIEKAKEYGILKAIGFKNRQLYVIVLEQALTTAVIGSAVGAVLAYALNPIVTTIVPQFVTQIRLIDIAWIVVVTILMAIVSSYIPIRRLSKIDPAEVFRA